MPSKKPLNFNPEPWRGSNWASAQELQALRREYPQLQHWPDDSLCQAYSNFSEQLYHTSWYPFKYTDEFLSYLLVTQKQPEIMQEGYFHKEYDSLMDQAIQELKEHEKP